MRKAFTLVEMLISLALGSLIFYYTYATINSTKNNHKTYEKAATKLIDSHVIFDLLHEDIQHSFGGVGAGNGKNYDNIRFFTTNSLYGMNKVYVTYFISKKDKALVRVESKEFFDIFTIGSNVEQKIPFMYSEVLAEDVKSFRISNKQNDKIEVMFQQENGDLLLFIVSRESS